MPTFTYGMNWLGPCQDTLDPIFFFHFFIFFFIWTLMSSESEGKNNNRAGVISEWKWHEWARIISATHVYCITISLCLNTLQFFLFNASRSLFFFIIPSLFHSVHELEIRQLFSALRGTASSLSLYIPQRQCDVFYQGKL